MHRAILAACFPWFLWLLAGFAGLWLLARISGARLELGRFRSLHRSEEGGIQTLSFVLTLPIFMMIVLFIVQVSQLMIGIVVVHYAAFAAARAASVWLPAEMQNEPANILDPIAINEDRSIYPVWVSKILVFNQIPPGRAWKYNKIWSAAALACIPIAPSHQYLKPSAFQSRNSNQGQTVARMYQTLVPKSAGDSVIPGRILNKNLYACEHTWITITGVDYDQNATMGPTYNPIGHPSPTDPLSPGFNDNVTYNQNEIGWQDPITVQVWFRFPLLTGPGRFLSPAHFLKAQLAPPDGTPDKVSSRIQIWDKDSHPDYAESVYWTQLTATATITSEGIKSSIPYVHYPEPID
jgi:hypothetical protein